MKYKDKSKKEFSSDEIFNYYNKQTLTYKRKVVVDLDKKLTKSLDSKSKKIFENYKLAVLDMHKKELEINFIRAFRQGVNFSL